MTNNLLLYLKNNISIIVLVIILRIFFKIVGLLKKQYTKKYIERIIIKKNLNKKEILKYITNNLIYKTMYALSDLLLFYITFGKDNFVLMLIILFLIKDLIDMYPTFNRYYNILNDNYLISEDTLLSKKIINNGKRKRLYTLLFKNYFDKYSNYVFVDNYIYNILNESTDYYLIFIKNSKNPIILNKNEYNLDISLNNKIIDIEKLNEDKNINVNLKKADKVKLTNEFIMSNISIKIKENKRKILILLLILIIVLVFIDNFSSNLFYLCLAIEIMIFLYFVFYNLYIYSVMKSIKNGKYTILKDQIISIKKNISGNNNKKINELKFNKYTKSYTTFGSLDNLNENDLVYLVILNTEELIGVYDAKKYYI